MPRAVIIGAGLGGLECGCMMAKEGWDVTVLEKGAQIGGCLQSFRRSGVAFETGLHYVGGLGENDILHILFDYLGLSSLPWVQIDPECVDEIHIADSIYKIPSGWERFTSYLSSLFPGQEEGLRKYSGTIQEIGRSNFDLDSPDRDKSAMGTSAHEFLCSIFTDPRLIELLEADITRLNYSSGNLPLYVYAQIRNSFTQSAWRLEGGGSVLTRALASEIESNGGHIVTGAEVVEIRENDGKAESALTADGRSFESDLFISDAHPQRTAEMLMNAKSVKKSFRSRLSGMKNSMGALTVSIKLKPGSLEYRDCSIFVKEEGAGKGIMAFFGMPTEGKHSPSLDIIKPVDISCFEEWKDSPDYSKDKGYIARKEELASECIATACKHIPGLSQAIDKVYISTPLTYRRYTGTTDGSAFGIEKDWKSPLTTFISPRTPLRNLLLTGQSLNLHGILGVTLTSVLTCSEVLGVDFINKLIRR